MSNELLVLTPVAASIALIHTLAGPDHYLPFIAMARAGGWRTAKTVRVTILCGLGHVSSSIILALLGGAAVVGVQRMIRIEALRGEMAAWGLIAFGLAYGVWGLRRAIRRKSHQHAHTHADGTAHRHDHDHTGVHGHLHEAGGKTSLTPWVLFTIFVLGPCEPLIPLLMFPAVKQSLFGFVYISCLFAMVTVALALLACGLAIKFLGL